MKSSPADFHLPAAALAADPAKPWLALVFDYRGHGQSEYDRNPPQLRFLWALADLSAVIIAKVRIYSAEPGSFQFFQAPAMPKRL
jgi:predicted alpha/beta hydrolase